MMTTTTTKETGTNYDVSFPDRFEQFCHDGCDLYHIAVEKCLPSFETMKWTPVEHPNKIVGSITTEQESCPCVYINVWLLDENRFPLVHYVGETRRHCYAEITFRKDGVVHTVEYENNIKTSHVKLMEELTEQTESIPNELTIEDGCGLVGRYKNTHENQ